MKIRQQGLTLLEALITLLIVSIGLLGVAGLQLTALKTTNISFVRGNAALIAENMAERMQVNRNGLNDNEYSNIDTSLVAAAPANLCYDAATPCSSTDVTTKDVWDFATEINQAMPNGVGRIVCDDLDITDGDICTSGSTHTITVSWSESDSVQNAVLTRSFTLTVMP